MEMSTNNYCDFIIGKYNVNKKCNITNLRPTRNAPTSSVIMYDYLTINVCVCVCVFLSFLFSYIRSRFETPASARYSCLTRTIIICRNYTLAVLLKVLYAQNKRHYTIINTFKSIVWKRSIKCCYKKNALSDGLQKVSV